MRELDRKNHGIFKHEKWPNAKGVMVNTSSFTHQCRFRLGCGKVCNQLLCIAKRNKGEGGYRPDSANDHMDVHVDVKNAKVTRKNLEIGTFFSRRTAMNESVQVRDALAM